MADRHRFTASLFRDWLAARLVDNGRSDVVVVAGREVPMPNNSVYLRLSPAPGLEGEHTIEYVGIYLECLGMPNRLETSEEIAFLIDDIMLASDNNFDMENCRVYALTRPGSGPQQLSFADQDRYPLVCNYQAMVATHVHQTVV